jgi:hypothetical protein
LPGHDPKVRSKRRWSGLFRRVQGHDGCLAEKIV